MASTINISLPEPLAAFVTSQTEGGEYGTPSDHIGELVREDRQRQKAKQEAHLLSALDDEANAIEIPEHVLEHGNVVDFLKEKMSARG